MPLPLDEFERRSPATSARDWRARLAEGETVIGLWVVSASPLVAEIVGASGADWIIIDAEHSPNELVALIPQLQALGASPVFTVVRAQSKDSLHIGRLLDAGARGLMLPMVESAADARAIVAATRYAPVGTRGVGGGFARGARWNGIQDYLAEAENSFSLIAQIESVAGVSALPEILEVEGIDAFFFGPADLAASMGLLGQPRHPDVQDAVTRGIRTVVEHGRIAGVNAFGRDDALAYQGLGARLLAVGADVTLLVSGSAALVDGFDHLRSEKGS